VPFIVVIKKKGNIMMTVRRINGSRRFKGYDGRSYFVQDAHTAERNKGKYNLLVKENGSYTLCYDLCYNLLFFDTIKDAQRKVLYGTEFIRTM